MPTSEIREVILDILAKLDNPAHECSFWAALHRLRYVLEVGPGGDVLDCMAEAMRPGTSLSNAELQLLADRAYRAIFP